MEIPVTTPKQHELTTGDIVAFAFPFAEGGEKVRTCVIVDHDLTAGEVVVAYGTTNLCLKANPDHALALTVRSDWLAAGLHQASRFQMDRRIRVSLSDRRFRSHPTLETPWVGRLKPAMAIRIGAIYGLLQSVSRSQERAGVHPSPKSGQGARRGFLRCQKQNYPTMVDRRSLREAHDIYLGSA